MNDEANIGATGEELARLQEARDQLNKAADHYIKILSEAIDQLNAARTGADTQLPLSPVHANGFPTYSSINDTAKELHDTNTSISNCRLFLKKRKIL